MDEVLNLIVRVGHLRNDEVEEHDIGDKDYDDPSGPEHLSLKLSKLSCFEQSELKVTQRVSKDMHEVVQ